MRGMDTKTESFAKWFSDKFLDEVVWTKPITSAGSRRLTSAVVMGTSLIANVLKGELIETFSRFYYYFIKLNDIVLFIILQKRGKRK